LDLSFTEWTHPGDRARRPWPETIWCGVSLWRPERGKSGRPHEIAVTDRRIAKIVLKEILTGQILQKIFSRISSDSLAYPAADSGVSSFYASSAPI
jgi:hypothetical protein